MTALEFFKKVANENVETMKQAEKNKQTTCEISDMNGNKVKRYFWSLRWNDRPSTIANY